MLNSRPSRIDADEELIADARTSVTPAQMVEGKLWLLLRTQGYGVSLHQTNGPAHPRGHVDRVLQG